MKIYLLTHEREFNRPSNSGVVAKLATPVLVSRILWERKSPNKEVSTRLAGGNAALVYPAVDDKTVPASLADFDEFVLLDGTWQEARKMYNQSPYLKSACKVALMPGLPSEYGLRRNQRPGGLCTAECVIEILQAKGFDSAAEQVREDFRRFNLLNPEKNV